MSQELHSTHLSDKIGKPFRLFLKGGPDVAASLAGSQQTKANLLNEWVAGKQAAGASIEVHEEAGFPTAILLQVMSGMTLPQELVEQGLADEVIANQFSRKLFDQPADVIVLSILPDLLAETWQRNETGYLLAPPPDWQQKWSPAQRTWFESNFTRLGRCTVEQFREASARLVQRLQTEGRSQIVFFGVSSYDPVDKSHNYHSAGETLSLRAHRFNHELIQLSQDTGVIVLDVDRLLTVLGGEMHVKQIFSYSPQANKIVGLELLRIIEDLGYFDRHPLLRLVLPQLDQHFRRGSLVRWHAREGKWVKEGDSLFDFQIEEINRLKRVNTDRPGEIKTIEIASRNWNWTVRVTAADSGFLRQRLVSEQESCSAGDLLAILSVRDNERIQQDEASVAAAPTFRVVTNILETADSEL
jgi:hypothetical protein